MSNYDREQREMDALQQSSDRGLTFEVIGWMLLLFNIIPLTFLWVGLRSGSFFWTYWSVIEGAIGIVLVLIGRRYKAKAGSYVSRLDVEKAA
jgi:hypothetical protein